MTPSLEDFVHQPLPLDSRAIRIVRLEKDLKDGLIQCNIRNRDKQVGYAALSYTWGSDTDNKTILLNGRRFVVQRNLWDFLRLARQHPDLAGGPLWIDAMCIDQNNIQERNHQVRMMASIYKSAVCTISWLGGLLDPDGTSTMARFPSVNNPLSIRSFDGELEKCFQMLEAARHRLNYEDKCRLPTYKAIGPVLAVVEKICQHPYWSRIWIMQELILSSNRIIVFDQLTMHWTTLVKLLNVVIGENALASILDRGTSLETFKEWQNRNRPNRLAANRWFQAAIAEMRNHHYADYGFSSSSNIVSGHSPGAVAKLLIHGVVPNLSTRYELRRIHARFKDALVQQLASSISPVFVSSVWTGIELSTTKKGWGAYATNLSNFEMFARANCADRRDMIYGICSLFKELEGFDVDYSRDVYNLYYRACRFLFDKFGGRGTDKNAALQLLRNLGLGPIDLVFGGKAQIVSSTVSQEAAAIEAKAGPEHREYIKVGENCSFQLPLAGICAHCSKNFELRRPELPPNKFTHGSCSLMLCYKTFMVQDINDKLDHIAIYPQQFGGPAVDVWAEGERSSTHLSMEDSLIGHRYTLRDIVGIVKFHLTFYERHDRKGRERYEGYEWYRRRSDIENSFEAYLTPSTLPLPLITMNMLDILQLEDAAKLNFCLLLRQEGLLP